jgi:phosphoserine phosphatase RsbU/P
LASLVFLAGPNAGRRYKLGEGDYIIGRRSDCQVFVPDMRVSRQHARVTRREDGWHLEDLGSKSGTFLNEERVEHARLAHDDEIVIAQSRIRVELPGQTRNPGALDAAVTVVDLHDAAIYMSRDHGDSGAFASAPALAGIQDSQRELDLQERKLASLGAILEIAANTTDPDELMSAVTERLLDVFPQAGAVGVLVDADRAGELRVLCHASRAPQPAAPAALTVPATILEHVVRERRGALLRDVDRPRSAAEPTGSRMGAPVQARGNHYGVIYVECAAGAFRKEDLDLLTSIAAQTGLAIHAARMHRELLQRQRLELDLRVARQIQRSLLPGAPPAVVGLEFAIHYEPAYQIGGDFYDFVWLDTRRLALVIGDVAGKAISAALYMARLTSELRSGTGIARSPSQLLRRVNAEMLALGDDGMFATLVYAVYDTETRVLELTNAGHLVPLLRRGDRVRPLEDEAAHGPPVGVVAELDLGEARVQLEPGDLVLFSTDGVHEARDRHGVEYGLDRLTRRIQTARGGVDGVVGALLDDLDDHVGPGIQADDMTILAMALTGR